MIETFKKRNIYIDLMKGLLITLVVIGHLQYFEYDSRTLILIYSFHMHAFLIIGGLLSHIDENSKISTVLLKRIKGTLIPYFVFYLISFIIVPTSSNEQRINALKVVIYGIGIPPDDALNLPLWFLTFYFVVMTAFEIIQIIAYRITKLFVKAKATNVGAKATNVGANASIVETNASIVGAKQCEPSYRSECLQNHRHRELCERHFRCEMHESMLTQLITLIFISIIMYISFRYARIYKLKRLPYNIEIAGFCLGFVFFGNVLSRTQQTIINKIKSFANKNTLRKVYTILSLIYFLLIISIVWYKLSMPNGRIDLNARDYKNAFYMCIDAILGFLLFASFSYVVFFISSFAMKKLSALKASNKNSLNALTKYFYQLLDLPSKLFSYLGKNSLYILAYHVPSVFYTWAYIIPLFPHTLREKLAHNSIISIIIMTFLGIAFSLIMSVFHKAVRLIISKVKSH